MLAYNHEHFVRKALESVLAQEAKFSIEVVIGEDCSTDGTKKILNEFTSRYPHRIRTLYRDSNIGMMRNFLETFKACRGDYVAVCECDDYWTSPSKLEKQIDFLDANRDYTLSFHNAQVIYEHGNVKPHLFNQTELTPVGIREIVEWDWIIPTASIVVRRTAITKFPEDFCSFPSGDLALSILYASAGHVHYMHECMSVYRKHRGGAHYLGSVDLQRRLNSIRSENGMLQSLDRSLGGMHRESFQRRISQNERRIDYLRLTRLGHISPRLLWSSIQYLYYRSCWKWRANAHFHRRVRSA